MLDDTERADLLARAERDPAEADTALAELRVQREALHAFLVAGAEDTECLPAVRDRVKSDITTAYREAELSPRQAWVTAAAGLGPRLIARRMALAAAALLSGEQRTQVSACGRCSWQPR